MPAWTGERSRRMYLRPVRSSVPRRCSGRSPGGRANRTDPRTPARRTSSLRTPQWKIPLASRPSRHAWTGSRFTSCPTPPQRRRGNAARSRWLLARTVLRSRPQEDCPHGDGPRPDRDRFHAWGGAGHRPTDRPGRVAKGPLVFVEAAPPALGRQRARTSAPGSATFAVADGPSAGATSTLSLVETGRGPHGSALAVAARRMEEDRVQAILRSQRRRDSRSPWPGRETAHGPHGLSRPSAGSPRPRTVGQRPTPMARPSAAPLGGRTLASGPVGASRLGWAHGQPSRQPRIARSCRD